MIFDVFHTDYRKKGHEDTEINSLEELLLFIEKNGQTIIDVDKGKWSLEIYDDWRE
jgi:hypothetical protein